MAKIKAPKNPLNDLVAYRKSRDENQSTFWSRLGVTQSGGSRYESGRNVPTPTALLLLAFADGQLDEQALNKLQKKLAGTRTKAE